MTSGMCPPALRRGWFPVARAVDLDRPSQATVHGRRLVAFRSADGQPRVLADRCLHRGGALHGGAVVGAALAVTTRCSHDDIEDLIDRYRRRPCIGRSREPLARRRFSATFCPVLFARHRLEKAPEATVRESSGNGFSAVERCAGRALSLRCGAVSASTDRVAAPKGNGPRVDWAEDQPIRRIWASQGRNGNQLGSTCGVGRGARRWHRAWRRRLRERAGDRLRCGQQCVMRGRAGGRAMTAVIDEVAPSRVDTYRYPNIAALKCRATECDSAVGSLWL